MTLLSLLQPDPDVLRKAQRGDERAFAVILRAYETPIFNYIFRLTGDRMLAEDLTQDVFVRVFNGLPRFSLRCKFTTWMFQITKNRVLDELRARERRPNVCATLDEMPNLETLDQPAERLETVDAIWRAVHELNPDLKMALLLRDVVGLPYNEIADSLEITLATVKWRIFKAREEVQLALAARGDQLRRAGRGRGAPRAGRADPGQVTDRPTARGRGGSPGSRAIRTPGSRPASSRPDKRFSETSRAARRSRPSATRPWRLVRAADRSSRG